MNLKLKGQKTTYCANYKPNAHGDNAGIGLRTNNHSNGNFEDIAYLWPSDDGNDKLVINVDAAAAQGIQIEMVSKNGECEESYDR